MFQVSVCLLLDNLQELVPTIDKTRQFVKGSPESCCPSAEFSSQLSCVSSTVTVTRPVPMSMTTPTMVASVLPLTKNIGVPGIIPAKLHHCSTAATSVCRS